METSGYREGCLSCFSTLDPEDWQAEYRTFVQCHTCGTKYHRRCWVLRKRCVKCGRDQYETIDLPLVDPLQDLIRVPILPVAPVDNQHGRILLGIVLLLLIVGATVTGLVSVTDLNKPRLASVTQLSMRSPTIAPKSATSQVTTTSTPTPPPRIIPISTATVELNAVKSVATARPSPTIRLASPVPTAIMCPPAGDPIEPGPRDERKAKRGGGDAILFRWTGAPSGLASNLAYRLHLVMNIKKDNSYQSSATFTSREPRRQLNSSSETQYLVLSGQDLIVNWWVNVMIVTGTDQFGQVTGPDCGPESQHTFFTLKWMGGD